MPLELKQSALVKEVLNLLTLEAQARGQTLIFIGGSAIQEQLTKIRRLSVDLDLYYTGNSDELLFNLPAEYEVKPRKGLENRPFKYYELKKGHVLIKIDIATKTSNNIDIPFRNIEVKSVYPFKANLATFDYLLSSKFSALAIGTIGRLREKEDYQTNLLKDIFDSNQLIQDFGVNKEIWKTYLPQITKIQNEINKTSYSLSEVIESAVKTLLDTANIPEQDNKKLSNIIESFNARLDTQLDIWKYKTMSYRIAAYLKTFQNQGENAIEFIHKLEKFAGQKDKQTILKCKNSLLTIKELPQSQIKEMAITTPNALLYAYACYFDK